MLRLYTNGTYRVFQTSVAVPQRGSFKDQELRILKDTLSSHLYDTLNLKQTEGLASWHDVAVKLRVETQTSKVIVDELPADVTTLDFECPYMRPVVFVFINRRDHHWVFARMTALSKFLMRNIQGRKNRRTWRPQPVDITPFTMKKIVDLIITKKTVVDFGDVELTYTLEDGKINSRLNNFQFTFPDADILQLLRTGNNESETTMERLQWFIKHYIKLDLTNILLYRMNSRLVAIGQDGRIRIFGARPGGTAEIIPKTLVRICDGLSGVD